ncbi:dinuclear metal center YbgI/SA1388 family protein [Salirhabdus euzebyi]|uniref:GTP cyclohydrolase 1 type 2 homolog n=1 Tax=Salirhabdus euzebyi TaxID=394506 RepID=A0A841Q6Y4_9BACI|nr:Nif3-like dinuclear metal center hexameric protein [Salirhabdus euzebyi]MBB6454299.1 dinuclear metal center YbgI/SA1388 family protein [Salirhabdus euzebyi]
MNNAVTGHHIIKQLEKWAPKTLAMDGDKIGLHVGTLNKPVKKVMVTLDVLENVVDEAIEKNVDLIIAHHPFIFKALKVISPDNEKGRIIEKLIRNNISVYVAHTNLDVADGGINDMLMNELGFQKTNILVEMSREELFKLVVFVPETHQEEVRTALGDSGAGHIGDYSHCTFQTSGQGTFKPLEGSNPYIGKTNELERVNEVRMETIVPKSKLSLVLSEMENAHPYEEVAYDLYPVELEGKVFGLGRYAVLEEKITLEQFVKQIKERLDVPAVRVVGDLKKKIKTVGIIGGDGNKFIHQVKRKGVDVLITGDVYYHTAHDAMGIGLSMIDPGHHIEKVMKKGVKAFLDKQCRENDMKVEVITSTAITEPFQFL